jgi:hypothetical protein
MRAVVAAEIWHSSIGRPLPVIQRPHPATSASRSPRPGKPSATHGKRGQAVITVNNVKYETYYSFSKAMQLYIENKFIGRISNRLYRIVGATYDLEIRGRFKEGEMRAIAALKNKNFGDWTEFCQFLFEHKIAAAKESGVVPHRPRNLGPRPPWIESVDEARPRKSGQAIRHIVPSHLLGWAAENIPVDDAKKLFQSVAGYYAEAYNHWQGDGARYNYSDVHLLFGDIRPRMKAAASTEWEARRWIWALLYNHPGNLWVGHAGDNQTIGFMCGAVYGLLAKLKEVPADPDIKRQIDTALKAVEQISTAGRDETLRKQINDVLKDVTTDLLDAKSDAKGEGDAESESDIEVEVSPIEEAIGFVEDVAANLEFDVSALDDWPSVRKFRARFTAPDLSSQTLLDFLNQGFEGSLMGKWEGV